MSGAAGRTRVTARQLNRATLARQGLLERQALSVVDGVRRVVALQAQEPPSPYVALWNRIVDFDPAELDEAFRRHAVVKASLLRGTLHAVTADDYPSFHEAMLPVLRASRLRDRRYTSTGLTSADAERALELVVEFAARPRTKQEIEAMLSERLGAPVEPRLWWALRTFAPLVHAPIGGPWSFGRRQAFEAAPATGRARPPGVALQQLIWRYLEGFGPASAQDIAQFALQRQAQLRPALEALADRLVVLEGPDGGHLFDVPAGTIPPPDAAAPPRLLPMWDSSLLAYRDRSRIIPDEYRSQVIRRNGDVLATVLIDGTVRGVWRPTDDGIEVRTFRPLSAVQWAAVAREAEPLHAMVTSRDPGMYGRYRNWWHQLETAQARVVG